MVAHRIDIGRATFGTTGTGVKIGVLSDSVDFLPVSQASGDLGPVTVLPGQSGIPGIGEGTAMLEIVHDIAPDAALFFATGFESPAGFASNIMALRTAGCDIIIDDVFYFNESPFQDGIIAQAVNTVTADGALYFSAAGNAGSVLKARAGVYEGDFVDSGTNIPVLAGTGAINRFNNGSLNSNNNRIAASNGGAPVNLFWSDPLGASTNDYDLFVLDAALTTVVNASTNVQDGTQDPFEQSGISPGTNRRMVVVKKAGAAVRFLHLNTNRGRLDIATTGQTKGHSAAADAFSVAATPAATAFLGPGNPAGPFPAPFTSASVLELFSSDGPRRMFYNADGSAGQRRGTRACSSDGGVVRQKPDITAADGVATSLPFDGLATFFGTSAAAPHAAGIAALVKSAMPLATPSEIRTTLTSSAIDIEGAGLDINAGAGIVMADSALLASGAVPSAVLTLGTVTAAETETTGNNNASVDPGETASLTVQLLNLAGAAPATAVSATLEASSPHVTITSGSVTYPDIVVGGSATSTAPFEFSLSPDADCGEIVELTMTVTYAGGASSSQTFLAPDRHREPGRADLLQLHRPTGADPGRCRDRSAGDHGHGAPRGERAHRPHLRPDRSASTAPLPLPSRSATVGLDHGFVGDLVITLTSPSGTTVTLVNRLSAGSHGGHNFFDTVLDDAATISIQAPTNVDPFTGTFKPNDPLAAFDGEDPNGTWTLGVTDFFIGESGSVRAFSLVVTAASCLGCSVITVSPTSLPAGTIGANVQPDRHRRRWDLSLFVRGVRGQLAQRPRPGPAPRA